MRDSQEWRQPGFDEHYSSIPAKHATHLLESLIEISRQRGQVVQASLNDQNVFAAVPKRKLPAIGNNTPGISAILREQICGQVDAFDSREAQSLQRVKPIAAAAK